MTVDICMYLFLMGLSSICLIVCLVFQADTDAADKKRKRTFRKYTYRGVDLDQLLDMSRYNSLPTG